MDSAEMHVESLASSDGMESKGPEKKSNVVVEVWKN